MGAIRCNHHTPWLVEARISPDYPLQARINDAESVGIRLRHIGDVSPTLEGDIVRPLQTGQGLLDTLGLGIADGLSLCGIYCFVC